MIWTALLVLAVAPLTGWLLWTRLPGTDPDDPLEAVFAAALCAVYLVGCSALLLAGLGLLRPPLLTASVALVALALWRAPSRPRAWTRLSPADAAAALFVAVLAAAAFAPASEDLLGGRDGGTYANTAAWLAREGTLEVRSDALASTTGEWRRIFHASVLFPGFYIVHASSGQLAPQFLHLHPVYMAVGAWLGGPAGLFLVPPLFGTLSALAVFFFVRRTLGVAAAVIAASVLTLNLAQIWSARNPYSEPATQAGVFAALWCVAAAHRTGGMRWGVLGGIALGSCFLLRIDAPMMLLGLLPALVLLAGAAEQPSRWLARAFLPVTLLFAIWGAAHGWLFSRPYVVDLARLVHPLWAASAAAAIASMIALAFGPRLRGAVGVILGHGRALWAIASVLICAAFIFGMWIRPSLEPFAVRPQSGVRTYVEETVVRVGWYFSPVGMLLALAGFVLLLRRALVRRRVEWLPFLALFFLVAGLYFWNPRIYSDHPWMMRRFLPVVVPAMGVATAAAVFWLWSIPGRWRPAARTIA
ncbi:MAG TPA: hypothetical protein VNK41_06360, partial [Vicinamibacterales bacterium]|nr:hypothetical protein [Vicinamibacterales bacterium]